MGSSDKYEVVVVYGVDASKKLKTLLPAGTLKVITVPRPNQGWRKQKGAQAANKEDGSTPEQGELFH